MALEYKISISPTLDSEKAKATVENLKKAFADIDMSPLMESITKISEAFNSVAEKIKDFSSKFNEITESASNFNSKVENIKHSFDNTEKSVEKSTEILEKSTKLTGVQKDNFDKMVGSLAVVNLKL